MSERILIGKNAIITGANRGIGNAIVQKFAEQGCNIWACARKPNKTFEDEMNNLENEYSVNITPIYFDLGSSEEIKNGFKAIYADKKPIDILINAAGIVNTDIFQMTSIDNVRTVFEINFFSVLQLTQLCLKVMCRQKKGNIVNIASIAGLDSNPTNCTYGSSKAALISFTKTLASEISSYGIRVNAVAPGPTKTDMIQTVYEKVGDAILTRSAMGRLANPEEVANVVLFLATEQSSFVNGQVIRIDGGSK